MEPIPGSCGADLETELKSATDGDGHVALCPARGEWRPCESSTSFRGEGRASSRDVDRSMLNAAQASAGVARNSSKSVPALPNSATLRWSSPQLLSDSGTALPQSGRRWSSDIASPSTGSEPLLADSGRNRPTLRRGGPKLARFCRIRRGRAIWTEVGSISAQVRPGFGQAVSGVDPIRGGLCQICGELRQICPAMCKQRV